MRLTHGTRPSVAHNALVEGLKPRNMTKAKNRWSGAPSRRDAVYLSATYGLYFAQCATPREDGAWGLVEVDTDRLNPFCLAPDEDFLEQATRKGPHVGDNMEQRTRHYRTNLWNYACETDGKPNWLLSVEGLGNCAHKGPIPAEAVTRIAIVKRDVAWLLLSDPVISLINHHLLGSYYRSLTGLIFGDEPSPEAFEGFSGSALKQAWENEELRAGITVIERPKLVVPGNDNLLSTVA